MDIEPLIEQLVILNFKTKSLVKELGWSPENQAHDEVVKIEENDIVVDIGANVGFFTVYAHQFNPKKIICLEPDIKSYLTLLENTKNFEKHFNFKFLKPQAKVHSNGFISVVLDWKNLDNKKFSTSRFILKLLFL